MGRSYRQCVACGKRALSIATRCPACGRELLTPPAPEPRPARGGNRLLALAVVAGVLAAAAILTVTRLGPAPGTSNQPSAIVTVDSVASPPLGYAAPATARRDTASVAALPAASPTKLVTLTWTNVRKSRSRIAEVEAVLVPGATVMADSLERGWYRVALDSGVRGYAHRSTLTAPRRQAD